MVQLESQKCAEVLILSANSKLKTLSKVMTPMMKLQCNRFFFNKSDIAYLLIRYNDICADTKTLLSSNSSEEAKNNEKRDHNKMFLFEIVINIK